MVRLTNCPKCGDKLFLRPLVPYDLVKSHILFTEDETIPAAKIAWTLYCIKLGHFQEIVLLV